MKHTLKPLTAALALSTAMLAAIPAAQAGRVERIEAELASAQYVPGEFLVQYRRGADRGMQADARRRVGAERVESVVAESRRSDGSGELELVRLPPGVGLATALDRIMEDPAVEFAEANWIYYHDATSNDTYYTNGSLWGMYGSNTSPANQYGSGAAVAWVGTGLDDVTKTNCSNVYVGIIDEGYMYTHADLAANAGTNPREIAGNGIDDDGNGYKDDVYGWDFDGRNNSVYDGTQDDHGTHVAGTIGAVGGNGQGVAGVCWSVKLMNAKFLGRAGGTTANAIKAVDYFTDLKTRHGLNLVATNNSWGGGGYSQSLYAAIERANAANILFIAAAGNGGSDGVGDNNDGTPHYPSSYTNSNIIAVASITSSGAKSSWSNYGVTSVDIGAPGSGIYSTLPYKSGAAKYGSYSGTSMATPHVTGAAALYRARNSGADAAAIKGAILDAATQTSSMGGITVTGDRLNVSGF